MSTGALSHVRPNSQHERHGHGPRIVSVSWQTWIICDGPLANIIDYKSPWSIFVRPPRSSNSMSLRSHATRKPVDCRQHTSIKTKCRSQDSSSSSSIIPPGVCKGMIPSIKHANSGTLSNRRNVMSSWFRPFFLMKLSVTQNCKAFIQKGVAIMATNNFRFGLAANLEQFGQSEPFATCSCHVGAFWWIAHLNWVISQLGSLICNQNAAPKQFRLAQAMENGLLP